MLAFSGAAVAILAAAGVVLEAAAPVGASAVSAAVRVSVSLPNVVTAGTAVTIAGRVSHAPADATAELESRAPSGGRWTVLARAKISHGRFSLRWTPRTSSFLTSRVIVVRRGRTLASTKTAMILVGAAPVYCAAPSPPGSLPAGDGYIVGGVYNVGGPAPGITVCQGQANTVTVTSAAGATVATQNVAGGQSYTFVVPAGMYTLQAGFCSGTATVRAGAETKADTVCPVP
jgi:hypothetical protein